MECENKQHAEHYSLGQFAPTQSPHQQWTLFTQKVITASCQHRREGDRSNPWHPACPADQDQYRCHEQLTCCESPAVSDFRYGARYPGGVDSKLHVMNLIAGKEQIDKPQRPGCNAELSRYHVVGGGSGCGQSDCADDF